MGKVIDNGAVRLEIVSSSGELLEMKATYRGGSKAPPLHYHPRQEERFDVERGQMRFVVNGQEHIVRAGEEIVVPARAHHTVRNASADEEAHVVWRVRPALRTARLFDVMQGLAGKRDLLTLGLVLREFDQELVLSRPPRIVQTCVFGLLAGIARLAGRSLPTSAPM